MPEAARRHAKLGPEGDADDDVEAIPLASAGRALLFPQFAAGAKAALESMPRNVAAIAMRKVAALAAGDAAAWGAIKQAKDTAAGADGTHRHASPLALPHR